MSTLLYLLKVDLVFAVFLLAYLPLRNDARLVFRRGWLLAGGLLAWALPLLPGLLVEPVTFSFTLPEVVLGAGAEAGSPLGLGWTAWLPLAYAVVVAGLMLRLLVRAFHAWRLAGVEGAEPLSFLGRIRVPGEADGDDREALIAHERAHVEQGHSLDVLLFELFAAIHWPVPLWRWALRELRLVHELLADRAAQHAHPHYDALLLARALGVPARALVHSFRSSDLKTRIHMLNTPRSKKGSLLRTALVLPALLGALLLVSWNAVPFRPAPQEPMKVAEKMPEFKGGKQAMFTYLVNELKYPATAKADDAAGTVFVGFVVDADGHVRDAQVKRGVHKALDAEALRVVKAMPDWDPGMHEGKMVPVEMTLPIRFELPKEK